MDGNSQHSLIGLLQLVSVATSNPHVADVISSLTWKVQARGVSGFYIQGEGNVHELFLPPSPLSLSLSLSPG